MNLYFGGALNDDQHTNTNTQQHTDRPTELYIYLLSLLDVYECEIKLNG